MSQFYEHIFQVGGSTTNKIYSIEAAHWGKVIFPEAPILRTPAFVWVVFLQMTGFPPVDHCITPVFFFWVGGNQESTLMQMLHGHFEGISFTTSASPADDDSGDTS